MALSNYTDLKTSIGAWVARSDLTTQLDDFIDMAEAELNRTVRTTQMLAETTLTTSASSDSVNLPSDFLEIDSISFNTSPREIEFVPSRSLLAYSSTTADRPKACALRASVSSGGVQRLKFNCPADGAYSLTLSYYQKITALSSSNTSNWFLTKEPQAYLFCSLDKALSYIEDGARKAEIKTEWLNIKNELQKEESGKRSGGAGTRVVVTSGVV